MVFHKISHNRTADAVVSQIEDLVMEGILRPGDQLPPERELAKKVDVSRPILRDAIKSLEGDGILVSKQGGGTFVADIIGTIFSDPIVGLFKKTKRATLDYLEFRREVEGTAAALAAERATPEDREILNRIITAMDAAHKKDDFTEETTIDVEFHTAIGEATHNIVMQHMLRSCYRLLAEGVVYNRSELYRRPGCRDRLMEQHRDIYEGIINSDPETAKQAARAHMIYVDTMLKNIELTGARQEISRMRLERLGSLK